MKGKYSCWKERRESMMVCVICGCEAIDTTSRAIITERHCRGAFSLPIFTFVYLQTIFFPCSLSWLIQSPLNHCTLFHLLIFTLISRWITQLCSDGDKVNKDWQELLKGERIQIVRNRKSERGSKVEGVKEPKDERENLTSYAMSMGRGASERNNDD